MKAIVNPILEKPCKLCAVVKDISEFSPTGSFASGAVRHHIYCKPCHSSYRRARYTSDMGHAKYLKRTKLAPEIYAEQMRDRRAKKPEQYRAALIAWKNANKDKVRIHDANKRHRRRAALNASGATLSASDWAAIVSFSKGQCFYCGMAFSKPTMDHFLAISKGGQHSADNVVPACSMCNSKKNNRDAFQFASSQGRELVVVEDIKKSERKIKAEILVAVTAIPEGLFWNNPTGTLPTSHTTHIKFGLVGSPDVLGCYRGRFVGIEVKTATGRQSDHQKTFQRVFERSGGIYILARSVQDALAGLEAVQ